MKQVFQGDLWNHETSLEDESSLLKRVNEGYEITFGHMPQPSLSAQTLLIRAINTYAFDGEHYTSFALSHEQNSHIQLILHKAQDIEYIALSQKLTDEQKEKLFGKNLLGKLLNTPKKIKVTLPTDMIELKGWLTESYEPVLLHVKGAKYQGDYRYQPFSQEELTGEKMDYSLCTSENREFAIEIEHYGGDHIDVYATIFRTVSDITEVKKSTTEIIETPAPTPVDSAPKEKDKKSNIQLVKPKKLKQNIRKEETQNEVIKDDLEFDVKLALKLMEEADRNDMSLDKVIRKVLDLDFNAKDTIKLSFEISKQDFERLAERHGVKNNDKSDIKAKIIEELNAFVGKR